MSIEAEVQTAEAEALVRFLAADANYGKKYTPYLISNSLKDIKVSYRKIEKVLSMLALRFPNILGYERLSTSMYFSLVAPKAEFQDWFQTWFQKEF